MKIKDILSVGFTGLLMALGFALAAIAAITFEPIIWIGGVIFTLGVVLSFIRLILSMVEKWMK